MIKNTNLRLKNKVAIVVGGGQRIGETIGNGRAVSITYAKQGAKVVVVDNNLDAAQETVHKIKENGGIGFAYQADVVVETEIAALINYVRLNFGQIDILHNNAGGSTLQDGPVTEAPIEEFWRCINLDLLGTFLCSKYVIPEIIKSGGGSVINMSSNVALMALPGRDCYTAVKGAIASMTRSMAVEYAPNKIRVNAIAPSVTLSDRVKKLLDNSPEIETIAKKHLLGLGEPIHVADLAVYLASKESKDFCFSSEYFDLVEEGRFFLLIFL